MARPSEGSRPVALVTGASGFTGRYLTRELSDAGYATVGWGQGGGLQSVNLTDLEQVRAAVAATKPDVVVHLAAISFVAHSDVEEIYRVNVVGTRNLLEALSKLPRPPRHIILASSANIYGNAGGVIEESSALSPQNDYAVSKLAMEYMAALWSDRLSITIVRPFNYTGVGQAEKFLLPKIVSHFRKGERQIELGNIGVSRDFNDVRNVVGVYRRLLDAEPGGVLNVCTGREHTLGDVIAMMEEIAGYSIEVRVNPDFVRANEVQRLLGSTARLVQRVGVVPGYSLRETLSWMYHETSN